LGYGHTWLAIWVLPLGFLVGLVFGAFGLVMNALAQNYDFFTYFFTLVLTPMLLFSGVYFPTEQMPATLASIANVLPLKHAIDIARPLMLGHAPTGISLHIAVLAAYAVVAYYVKLALVALLVAFHLYLGVLMRDFARERNRHSHVFYRWLNEIPALPILFAIVFLVVMKPF